MGSSDPEQLTRVVVGALRRSKCRGILLSGWAGIGKMDVGDDIYVSDALPHYWLYPRCVAVVHHGGAGSTAAGLRAGTPTVIVPFLGDQPSWGDFVAQLGVGPKPVPGRRLNEKRLARSLTRATTDPDMRRRAVELSKRIRVEDGVAQAVSFIERWSHTRV